MVKHFLLFGPTGYSWPVTTDPVSWLLANADNPFLERVRDRLVTLGPGDGEMVLRLAMKCRLAVVTLDVDAVRVICRYRGDPPELRPFLRRHRLDQHEVVFVNTDLVAIEPARAILGRNPSVDEAWTVLDV